MHPLIEATLKSWKEDETSITEGMIVECLSPHSNPFTDPIVLYGVVCHVIPPTVRKVGTDVVTLRLEERTIVRLIGYSSNYSMSSLSMAKIIDELPAGYEAPK
ncbi:hypothetical protein D9M68_19060 [compost metagenome]